VGKGRCLLDRELSTLPMRKSVSALAMHQDRAVRHLLTEITRRSEVLPAFCNPIMVTSISVALHRISPPTPGIAGDAPPMRCGPVVPRSSAARGRCMAAKTHQNVRNSQSYTFLKSPAMVVEGHAVVERAASAEGVGEPGQGAGQDKESRADVSQVEVFSRASFGTGSMGWVMDGWAVTGLSWDQFKYSAPRLGGRAQGYE
jgi:hypothetical protein